MPRWTSCPTRSRLSGRRPLRPCGAGLPASAWALEGPAVCAVRYGAGQVVTALSEAPGARAGQRREFDMAPVLQIIRIAYDPVRAPRIIHFFGRARAIHALARDELGATYSVTGRAPASGSGRM